MGCPGRRHVLYNTSDPMTGHDIPMPAGNSLVSAMAVFSSST